MLFKKKCKNAGKYLYCQQWFLTMHCGRNYCPVCKSEEEREKEKIKNREKYERKKSMLNKKIGMYMLRR